MGSKTISLDDEAYRLLKAAKLPDESFSEVVKRTLGATRPKIMDLVGLLSETEGKAVAGTVRRLRKADRGTSRARQDRLWR